MDPHEKTLLDYIEVLQRRKWQMIIQLAQELEKDSKGERFRLLDSPRLPSKLSKPNWLLILLFRFILSIGGGLAVIVTAEVLDDRLRGAKTVIAIAGTHLIGVIPYIDTEKEVRQSRVNVLLLMVAALGLGVGGLYAAHVYIV